MNPFENIHEEKWNSADVKTLFLQICLDKKFRCIDPSNPYQNVTITGTRVVPITLLIKLNQVEHLHNNELPMNLAFNTHMHELSGTCTFNHNPETTKTNVSWKVESSFELDENVLDFPTTRDYILTHYNTKEFLKHFDRVCYNMLMSMRAIKEIYHKETFAVNQ